jgi:hypothetical protein
MPEFREAAACLGFWPSLLAVGNDLLVYAFRIPPDDPKAEYITSICTRTQLATTAAEDLAKLGKGKRPRISSLR